jgi:hypothetical protein
VTPSTNLASDVSPRSSVRGLPMAHLPTRVDSPAVSCAVAIVDPNGRLSDRLMIRLLGWQPGEPLTMGVIDGVITLRKDMTGKAMITRRGHLRLPTPTRRAYAIGPGSRLLLVVPENGAALEIYTMPRLTAQLCSGRAPEQSHLGSA